MTKQDFDLLTPYVGLLQQAREDYFHGLDADARRVIVEVYNRMFGRNLSPADQTCGSCMLNVLRKLATAYFWQEAQNAHPIAQKSAGTPAVVTKATKAKKTTKKAKK